MLNSVLWGFIIAGVSAFMAQVLNMLVIKRQYGYTPLAIAGFTVIGMRAFDYVWWATLLGASVGVLYAMYFIGLLQARNGRTEKPPRRLMMLATLLSGVWIAATYITLFGVMSTSIKTMEREQSAKAEAFKERGRAARFVYDNYIPCRNWSTTVPTSSSRFATKQVVTNPPLSCRAQAVELATAQDGLEFAHEVVLAVGQWDDLLATETAAEKDANRAVAELAK